MIRSKELVGFKQPVYLTPYAAQAIRLATEQARREGSFSAHEGHLLHGIVETTRVVAVLDSASEADRTENTRLVAVFDEVGISTDRIRAYYIEIFGERRSEVPDNSQILWEPDMADAIRRGVGDALVNSSEVVTRLNLLRGIALRDMHDRFADRGHIFPGLGVDPDKVLSMTARHSIGDMMAAIDYRAVRYIKRTPRAAS